MHENTDQAFDLEVCAYESRACRWLACMHVSIADLQSEWSMPQPNRNICHMQAYAASYTSHGKVNRLLFIASKSDHAGTQLDALRLAADEVAPVSASHPSS